MLPHNKIIKTTVKKFLEPENLFQIRKLKMLVRRPRILYDSY